MNPQYYKEDEIDAMFAALPQGGGGGGGGGVTDHLLLTNIGTNTHAQIDTHITATQTALNSKQDTLVSGFNIKTINGNSLVGGGNLSMIPDSIPTDGSSATVTSNGVFDALAKKQSIFPKYPVNFDKIGIAGSSMSLGSWPTTLGDTLNTVLGRTITIDNDAIWGQSSTGMVSTLPALIAQAPQIILLEISINDANVPGVSYIQSENNYRNMIAQCNNSNIVPVLFNCFPIDIGLITAGNHGSFTQAKRTDLCNLSRKLSIELNVQLIDIDLVCAQNTAILFGDGLHLSTPIGNLFATNVISGEIIKQATIINQLPI